MTDAEYKCEFEPTKDTHIWDAICDDLVENWQRYNSTDLYLTM